jgi:hypothetical protein
VIGKKIFLFAIMLSLVGTVFTEESIESQLRKNAISHEPAFFHDEDTFVYLGKIPSIDGFLYFAFNKYYWGHDRLTSRLCLFNSSKSLIGDYYGLFIIPKIEGTSLVFEGEEVDWTIDFAKGIVKRLIVKGDIYTFNTY